MTFINKTLATFVLIVGMNGQVLAIPMISGDGTETCVDGTSACSLQAISVHGAWETNNPNGNGAQWISYADTGVSGGTLATPSGTTSIFTVTESFSTNIGDMLYLDVWADDTAEVFLNNISIFSANFTQSTCANGSIGCQPGENGVISYTFDSSGLQTLSFDVFQVGTGTSNRANPFGLLYSGTLTSASVPEPSILALMSLGLLGLGLIRRKTK